MSGLRSRAVRTIACAGALGLAGCSTGSAQAPGSTAAESTPHNTVTTERATPPPTHPAPRPPRHVTKLPGTCDSLLPQSLVDTALGRPITGHTAFVVGASEPDIGRIVYLNCRYGLPAGSAADTATAKLEIGISLYRTPLFASRRIPATVGDYADHGASSTQVTVDDVPAVILTRGSGNAYADPTIVAASGQRTVAITLVETSGHSITKDLTALARLALNRSAG